MNSKRIWEVNSYIQMKGEVHLSELLALFPGVSAMTIRRDIDYLEKQGHIVRTRGGAKSINHLTRLKEEVYETRAAENTPAKTEIAQKAIPFLENEQSFYFDSGTTVMCLAKIIPGNHHFMITSGPNIAMQLSKSNTEPVVIVGGKLNPDNLSISGANALDQIKNINVNVAFIATSGFSLQTGFTVGNFDEAELKRTIISRARKTVVLMDSSKLENSLPYTFANLSDVDYLVSEKELPPEIRDAARQYDTALL